VPAPISANATPPAAKLVGVDPQLLAYQRVERDVLVGHQPVGESARRRFVEPLGLVDQHHLLFFFFRDAL
jgi:hypothetical protein